MGRIEVITGPMFAEKTTELLRRLYRSKRARQAFLLVKPSIDKRYSETEVVTHTGISVPATIVSSNQDIITAWEAAGCPKVLGIDEGQFLPDLPALCEDMANKGVRVIVAGLDLGYKGRPFGPMPELLALADQVTKLTAICEVCGEDATKTHRLVPVEGLNVIGGAECYEARCRAHFTRGA